MEFHQATSAEDIESVRTLFREYETELGVDLCFQGFQAELAGLPGEYAPPSGRLLLARSGDRLAGCVALRRFSEGIGEMKRLYVRPEFRGHRLGRSLTEAVLEEARRVGYLHLRLDTLPSMTAAIALYRSFGFQVIAPYRRNPVPGAVYMERDLGSPRLD